MDDELDNHKATDVLMGFIHEHWEEMRHIENQRATMANLILTLAAALIGLIANFKISQNTLLLSLALVFLGIYGWIATAKLYERHQFDQNRLYKWYKQIDRLNPKAKYAIPQNSLFDSLKTLWNIPISGLNGRVEAFHLVSCGKRQNAP
jgi:hypothetical protein